MLWLPQYHDLGLVGGILTSILWNSLDVRFSPVDFVRDPLLWPHLMSRYRCTVTAGPHFAYELVARRLEAAKEPPKIDLSSLAAAFDCAEPVNVGTRDAMLQTWKSFGLRDAAWNAAYGLAEHVVKVSLGGSEGPDGRGIVNGVQDCGVPAEDICVKIVNPETREESPEGEEGEVWLDSPSKAQLNACDRMCGCTQAQVIIPNSMRPQSSEPPRILSTLGTAPCIPGTLLKTTEQRTQSLQRYCANYLQHVAICPLVCQFAVPGTLKAAGYWGKAKLSEEVFRAKIPGCERSFLRTGDLGFMRKGRLFISCRIKNLIIVAGKSLGCHSIYVCLTL